MADDSTANSSEHILERLAVRIAERKSASPEHSYTARMSASGIGRIRQKVGEEAIEVILAHGHTELAAEAADLLYHLLLLFEVSGMSVHNVYAELERRLQASN